MFTSIPIVKGVSMLQRSSKDLITQVKKSNQPIFLSERGSISAVLLSKDLYSQLTNSLKKNEEEAYWLEASFKSLEFWDNKEDDIWNKV